MPIFEFDGQMTGDNDLAKLLRRMMEEINALDERIKRLEKGGA
jgi:hypothetical protein